jgi:hypothetical protein
VTWASNGIALPPHSVLATTNADYFVVTPRSTNQNIGTPVTYTVITVTDTGDTTLCSTNRAAGIDSGASIMVNPGSSVSVALGAANISALTSNQNLVVWATNIFGTNVQVRTRSSVVVTQSPGGLVTGVVLPSLMLSLTNQVNFAGGTSWHAVWQTISADRSGGSLQTNFNSRVYNQASTNELFQFVIRTNTPGTNFTISIVSLSNDTCIASAAALPPAIKVSVNATLGANVSLSGPDNFYCAGAADLVADLSGTPPWTIIWSDGIPSLNVSRTPFIRSVSLTNSLPVVTNYTYFITNLGDFSTPITALTSNDTRAATITVNPVPSMPTLAYPGLTNGAVYSCSEVAALLSVSVISPYVAAWYDPANSGNTVISTNYFAIPPKNGAFPLTNTYMVTARYVDPDASCESSALAIKVVFTACTNKSIDLVSVTSSNLVLGWQGNYYLEHATNLSLPTVWQTLARGLFYGTNWTNGFVGQQNYFRLNSTNSTAIASP